MSPGYSDQRDVNASLNHRSESQLVTRGLDLSTFCDTLNTMTIVCFSVFVRCNSESN